MWSEVRDILFCFPDDNRYYNLFTRQVWSPRQKHWWTVVCMLGAGIVSMVGIHFT